MSKRVGRMSNLGDVTSVRQENVLWLGLGVDQKGLNVEPGLGDPLTVHRWSVLFGIEGAQTAHTDSMFFHTSTDAGIKEKSQKFTTSALFRSPRRHNWTSRKHKWAQGTSKHKQGLRKQHRTKRARRTGIYFDSNPSWVLLWLVFTRSNLHLPEVRLLNPSMRVVVVLIWEDQLAILRPEDLLECKFSDSRGHSVCVLASNTVVHQRPLCVQMQQSSWKSLLKLTECGLQYGSNRFQKNTCHESDWNLRSFPEGFPSHVSQTTNSNNRSPSQSNRMSAAAYEFRQREPQGISGAWQSTSQGCHCRWLQFLLGLCK